MDQINPGKLHWEPVAGGLEMARFGAWVLTVGPDSNEIGWLWRSDLADWTDDHGTRHTGAGFSGNATTLWSAQKAALETAQTTLLG